MKCNVNFKRVVILQYRMFHYRSRLFEVMRDLCYQRGIFLDVVYGQPFGDEILKKDTVELDWGWKVNNYYFPIKEKKDICWQPIPRSLFGADLFIFMQENRLLVNYFLMLLRSIGFVRRVAYWGHGRDFQSRSPGGVREKWKRALICKVDWWFAYTEMTKRLVCDAGFSPEMVSVLKNGLDNKKLDDDLSSVSPQELFAFREGMSIPNDAQIGLYCGSLYEDKRLTDLVAVADEIHKINSKFCLVVAGDGAQRKYIETAASERDWLKYLGPIRGREKALLFSSALINLCPGAVGLNIVDGFSAALPIFTFLDSKHGPEIEYLIDGKNGRLLTGDVRIFAEAVDDVLSDGEKLKLFRASAKSTARDLSIEAMAERFVDGIVGCLNCGEK